MKRKPALPSLLTRASCCLLVALGVTLATPAASIAEQTEMGTGLAYGKNHAYFLTAPEGWVLDTECGAAQRVYAVFYPKSSDWDGPVAMYSNAAPRDGRTITEAIQKDIDHMQGRSAGIKVTDAGTTKTADGKVASLRYFTGDKFGNYEAVGYVPENKVVVNIVLTARNKAAFEEGLTPFRKLVESYRFVTDNPKIEDLPKLVREEKERTEKLRPVDKETADDKPNAPTPQAKKTDYAKPDATTPAEKEDESEE